MEETPDGTPVGVDDPYEYAGPCDHLTGDGRCRYALDHASHDPKFAAERRADDYQCLVADEDADWPDCPHYRSTTDGKSCARCGLEEVRMAHDAARPLVEEHHLSYGTGRSPGNRGDAAEEGSGGGSRRPSSDRAREGRPNGDRSDASPDGADRPYPRHLAAPPADEDDATDGIGETAVDEGGSVEAGSSAGASAGDVDRAEDEADREDDADDASSHEITIGLCRWCHAKVHKGFARVDDDANPDPEAIAERESRRGVEMGEFGFSTARERRRDE